MLAGFAEKFTRAGKARKQTPGSEGSFDSLRLSGLSDMSDLKVPCPQAKDVGVEVHLRKGLIEARLA